MGMKTELYNDNFQNFKKYNIPKAQLVIADIPYNLGVNAYASSTEWYIDGDNTNAGNKWFKPEYQERFPDREQKREDAVSFFMAFWNADCPRVAIENPQGIMSSRFRKPDQYIEPYMFGDSEKKKTGLWLRGLPALAPTNVVEPIIIECASGAREPRWHMETMHLPPKERSKARSKTFPGIARAMAEQWGGICDE